MDEREKIEFVKNELTAIYEEYAALVDLQILTKKFLKNLVEFVSETGSDYVKNKDGEYILSPGMRLV